MWWGVGVEGGRGGMVGAEEFWSSMTVIVMSFCGALRKQK